MTSEKRVAWTDNEIKLVQDAVRKSSNVPVKDLVDDIAETLGRTDQSVRNRFYREKQDLENSSGVKFDRRYSPYRSNGNGEGKPVNTAVGIFQSLEYIESDLKDLEDMIKEVRSNLQAAKANARVVEDWVKDTLEIKKMLTATVDSSGVVEKVSVAR